MASTRSSMTAGIILSPGFSEANKEQMMMFDGSELVISKDDARKALRELKKENEAMQAEINKLNQVKVFYQKQKEHLLTRHSKFKCDIDERQQRIAEEKQKKPEELRNRFGQLYPLVEDVYYKELLLLELKEQLYSAQTQQEKRDILLVLKATDLRLCEDHEKRRDDADDPVTAWHRYMTQFVKENTRISKQKNRKSSCLLSNAVFYNVKFNCDSTSSTLTFSTRHRGICVFISIQRDRSSSCTPPFCLTSDLPLPDLQSKGIPYLQNRRNPVDFVMEVIWKEVEDHLLPFM